MSLKNSLFQCILLITALVFCSSSASKPAGDDAVPAWLQLASKTSAPVYQKDVPAVVLHNEQTVDVRSDGVLTVTNHWAIRLLTRNGKKWADGVASYLQSSSKVREIRGWLMRPNGTTKFYGKDKVLDTVSDPDDIYDEQRVKTISASEDADIGMVIGYETVTEERPLFTQDSFGFQRALPVIFARYSLNMPDGWQATSITFNRPEIKPAINGSSYVWELRDMDPIPPEPDSPSYANLSPRIVVNYFPPTSNHHVYETWHDVSQWYTDLSSSSLTLDDNVAAKARELTENAKTDLERIRAIGGYVQGMRYIALQLDVAHGGGHRPRPANLVLQRGFGDCKDKANLMRAMLKAVKIESYLVLIYAGDPSYVRSEWPSPEQFNHCIIAIRVGGETNVPAIVTNEKLGKLLIFDSTDPYTQVGDLPEREQGSFALVSAGPDGDLLKMPTLPPEANSIERNAEIVLTADGSISGIIHQRSLGQSASYERGRLRTLSAAEYKSSLERWLTNRIKGGRLTKIEPNDGKENGRFDLDIGLDAQMYAQIMQGRLMMFNAGMVGRLDQFIPVEGKRVTPILIDASTYSETIRIKLPDGFAVDEMPDADKIETAYGKYSSKFEVTGGYLLFSRSLELYRTIVPPMGYEDVRKFFSVVRKAEITPVVLVKK